MMPRKFTDEQLDQADKLHADGEKWEVINLMLGAGINQACWYRRSIGYIGTYNEDLETKQALSAWSGIGDKQSFLDGWKFRAKKDRYLS